MISKKTLLLQKILSSAKDRGLEVIELKTRIKVKVKFDNVDAEIYNIISKDIRYKLLNKYRRRKVRDFIDNFVLEYTIIKNVKDLEKFLEKLESGKIREEYRKALLEAVNSVLIEQIRAQYKRRAYKKIREMFFEALKKKDYKRANKLFEDYYNITKEAFKKYLRKMFSELDRLAKQYYVIIVDFKGHYVLINLFDTRKALESYVFYDDKFAVSRQLLIDLEKNEVKELELEYYDEKEQVYKKRVYYSIEEYFKDVIGKL